MLGHAFEGTLREHDVATTGFGCFGGDNWENRRRIDFDNHALKLDLLVEFELLNGAEELVLRVALLGNNETKVLSHAFILTHHRNNDRTYLHDESMHTCVCLHCTKFSQKTLPPAPPH